MEFFDNNFFFNTPCDSFDFERDFATCEDPQQNHVVNTQPCFEENHDNAISPYNMTNNIDLITSMAQPSRDGYIENKNSCFTQLTNNTNQPDISNNTDACESGFEFRDFPLPDNQAGSLQTLETMTQDFKVQNQSVPLDAISIFLNTLCPEISKNIDKLINQVKSIIIEQQPTISKFIATKSSTDEDKNLGILQKPIQKVAHNQNKNRDQVTQKSLSLNTPGATESGHASKFLDQDTPIAKLVSKYSKTSLYVFANKSDRDMYATDDRLVLSLIDYLENVAEKHLCSSQWDYAQNNKVELLMNITNRSKNEIEQLLNNYYSNPNIAIIPNELKEYYKTLYSNKIEEVKTRFEERERKKYFDRLKNSNTNTQVTLKNGRN